MNIPYPFIIKKEEQRPCSYLLTDSDALRKAVIEHPGYPILGFATEEANGGDFYASSCDISVKVGEFLNCQQKINDELVFTDRDDFEECIWDRIDLYIYSEGLKMTEDEQDELCKAIMAQYEEFWTPCIILTAQN